MFGKNRKANSQPKTYQIMYNEYHSIQVCEIDPQTGLALKLIGVFTNTGAYARWQRENNIQAFQCVWGNANDNADIEFSRKYAM